MKETTTDIFEKLKRSKPLITKEKSVQAVFFQLNFDTDGAYLCVINEKGKQISPGHEYFAGPTREVLKSIENIRKQNSFRIDWNKPGGQIYLSEHDYLFWPLRQCDNFVDDSMKRLRFSDEESRIRMIIDENKKGMLKSRIVLSHGGKRLEPVQLLNESHAIAEDLEKDGIKYLLMTGATRDRKLLVEQFQEDESCKVFLMTLKTGGIGLNLTAADYIFIFDPWWNKAAENQAIDRTHRIGQDKTVFAYKLITRGTIEEKILQLQEKKSELFDRLISSDGASIKSLNETDVEFVLGV